MNKHALIIVYLVLMAPVAQSQIDSFSGLIIKRDNEAPQVTHIIPWKNPKGAERLYSPIQATPVKQLLPIDPYDFAVEIKLYKQWIDSKQDNPVTFGQLESKE